MKHLLTYLFAFCALAGSAQKHDYTWLAGYSSNAGYSTNFNYWFGISKYDFTKQPVSITYDSLGINLKGANCAMSNEDGAVQFYTNGITVRNYLDEIIGDSLHNGYFLNNLPLWYYGGNPSSGLMLVLPNPSNSEKYDIIYGFVDTLPSFFITVKRILRTQVDMSLNFGKGGLVYKDKPISQSESSFSLTAVRHANGKDWWLVTMKAGTNCYDLMLYDGSDSVRKYSLQCIGSHIYNRGEFSVLSFSPDGRYFASVNDEQGKLDFYEFNRCSGNISLLETIYLPENIDSVDYHTSSGAYSPNSRFFYLCSTKEIFQFDMLSTSIAASKTSIAKYIQYHSPAPVTYNFAQLAPDGKIYIASLNTTYYMAAINNPDQVGTGCNFQDTVKLPSFIAGLPYYPNYRLGALHGSPCDTLKPIMGLEATDRNENQLKVFPNPAVNEVVIDYGFTNWGKGNVTLQITNGLGQVVHTQTLPLYSSFQKLNISPYPAGTYLITLLRGTQTIATTPLVKE